MPQPIRFKVAELVEEVALMEQLAGKFLDNANPGVLAHVKDQLEQLRYAQQKIKVATTAGWPIRTMQCDGGYERKEGGQRKDLFGELTFQWELKPLGPASRGRGTSRLAEIAGIASSVIRLKVVQDGSNVAVASWRMELGDNVSPGAFFHAQIPDTTEPTSSDENQTPPTMWPTWLPVPRLPIPPMTPMLALEFTLEELFRDKWRNHIGGGGHHADRWRSLQRERYVRFYEWQRKVADASGSGSPLLSVIDAKPQFDLFLSP